MNSRRLDVSDYDLGEGVVPTGDLQRSGPVHLWRGVHRDGGVSRHAEGAHRARQSRSVCDGYVQAGHAMDADGGAARDLEYESGEPARLFARPAGSFLDMAHDVAQPLNQAIQTNVRSCFQRRRCSVGSRARRWPIKLRTSWRCMRAAASSTTSSPRRLPISARPIRRMRRCLWAGSTDRWAAWASRREFRTARWMRRRRPTEAFQADFASDAACRDDCGESICPLAVNLNTFPSGTLKTPYFLRMESWARARTRRARLAARRLCWDARGA